MSFKICSYVAFYKRTLGRKAFANNGLAGADWAQLIPGMKCHETSPLYREVRFMTFFFVVCRSNKNLKGGGQHEGDHKLD